MDAAARSPYFTGMTKTTSSSFSRRSLILAAPALMIAACAKSGGASGQTFPGDAGAAFEGSEWRTLTEEDWRGRLSPLAYRVLREEATERAFTSPLNDEKRKGVFHCAGCDLPLFDSKWKYDSGTGWPSFWDYRDGALGFKEDNTLWMARTEYHCARCGGHQGHVFKDGPAPTGLRYCNNGVAISFKPA